MLAYPIIFLRIRHISLPYLYSNACTSGGLHSKTEAYKEDIDVVQDYLGSLNIDTEQTTQQEYNLKQ